MVIFNHFWVNLTDTLSRNTHPHKHTHLQPISRSLQITGSPCMALCTRLRTSVVGHATLLLKRLMWASASLACTALSGSLVSLGQSKFLDRAFNALYLSRVSSCHSPVSCVFLIPSLRPSCGTTSSATLISVRFCIHLLSFTFVNARSPAGAFFHPTPPPPLSPPLQAQALSPFWL